MDKNEKKRDERIPDAMENKFEEKKRSQFQPRRNIISKKKTNLGKKSKPKSKNTKKGSTLISESGKRKSFKKIPIGKTPEPISPTKRKMLNKQKQDQTVKQNLTQDYAYTGIPGAIAEPAGVTIPASKKPKLALRGGGRAYGRNS